MGGSGAGLVTAVSGAPIWERRTKRDGLLSLGIRRGLSFTFQFFPAVTNDFLFQDLVYLMGWSILG